MNALTALELKALAELQIASGDNGHDFGILEDVSWNGSRKQLGGLVTSLQEKGVIDGVYKTKVNDGDVITQYILAEEYKVSPAS